MASVTLDNMEYASDAAAQAAYVTNATLRSNADIDNEDMSDITDWTDGDTGTGASTQETFDSKSCMKLTSGATLGGVGVRTKDVGTFGARSVISINVYCDAIGTRVATDEFDFLVSDGTTRMFAMFCSDGLLIYDGSSFNEVGTDLVVQDTWQEWTFDINWTARTVDVYLAGILKASGVDCSADSGTANGTIYFGQGGGTTTNRISYVDWEMAGSDFIFQSYSEATIKTQGSYALKAVAAITDSLNKTLTKTFAVNKDLTGINTLSFTLYSNRTGSNIKFGLHDTGGTTTEITPNVTSANAQQTITVDLSAVSDANKNDINTFTITTVNADSSNTFYVDNFNIVFPALVETCTTSDTRTSGSNRILQDNNNLSDTYIRMWNIQKTCSDSFALVDDYNRLWDMAKTYMESVSIVDTYNRIWNISSRIFIDNITLSDELNRNRFKYLIETTILTDNITKVPEVTTWGSVTTGGGLWTLVSSPSNIWI